jgi:hypothetical protein
MESLQTSSATVRTIATALNDTLSCVDGPAKTAFLVDARPEAARQWEVSFAQSMAGGCLAATGALWAAARLLDGATDTVRDQAAYVARSRNGASSALGSLLAVEKNALQKGCRCHATSDECRKEFASLTSPLSGTCNIVSMPLETDCGHEALLTVGFSEGVTPGNGLVDRTLIDVAEGCSAALTAHRRIELLRSGALEEAKQTGHVCDPRYLAENAPFSFSILSGDNGKPGCGYAAAAFRPGGEARLFASRPGILGIGGVWEELTLNLLFRTACLACADTSEVSDLWSEKILPILPAGNCLFHFCCADFSESGREYRYIGDATHLVYENCTQMVEEVTHSTVDGPNGSNGRVRAVRLQSGDLVILHLCHLPTALCERHAMQRRLSGVLALAGRADIEALSGEVASILRVASSCPAHAPGLILLRSE